jgi:hypothetical protein
MFSRSSAASRAGGAVKIATRCPQAVRRPTGTVTAAYATRRKHAKLNARRTTPKTIRHRVAKVELANEFLAKIRAREHQAGAPPARSHCPQRVRDETGDDLVALTDLAYMGGAITTFILDRDASDAALLPTLRCA